MSPIQSEAGAAGPASLTRYQRQFVGHLRDPAATRPPEGVSPVRLGVYVDLLYNKIDDSLSACFPLTREHLGPEAWRALVREFIARHRCASPFYRRIPDEFIAYLQQVQAGAGAVPLWSELAHYEWMELTLEIAEDEPDPAAFDPDGDLLAGVPVLAPVLALLQYRYPVHRLGAAAASPVTEELPAAGPVFILGFRDGDDRVRFIEISAATARLIELLQAGGRTGYQALARLAEELRHPDLAALVSFGAEQLRDFRRQGAILGAKISSDPIPLRSHP